MKYHDWITKAARHHETADACTGKRRALHRLLAAWCVYRAEASLWLAPPCRGVPPLGREGRLYEAEEAFTEAFNDYKGTKA